MAEKLSDKMMRDLTGSQVTNAQQSLTTLQPQYQQLQDRLAQLRQEQVGIAQSGIDAPGNRERYTSVNSDLANTENQIKSLQDQISRQQSIISDPSQLMTAQDRDFVKGAKFGESVLGDEGLGRLGTDSEMMNIKGRLEEFAKGMSSEEMLAKKEIALQDINKQNLGSQRALQARLAQAGVKGAIGGSQLRDVAIAGLQQKTNLERDLMLQGREMERAGVQDLATFTGEVKKFDLGQAAKEKDIVLQSGMGLQQMGVAERSAQAQAEAERAAAAARSAAACFPKGTLVGTKYGLKPIEEIKPMDILHDGAIVQIVGKGVSDDLYKWRDIIITGEHCVLEDSGWLEVRHSKEAVKIDSPMIEVYNIFVTGHKLHVKGQVVADFASLYTLGGINAVINNQMQRLRKRGLSAISRVVEKVGMAISKIRDIAFNRNNNGN